jgi:hypothetical protein
MKRIIVYTIATGPTSDHLAERVNEMLNTGFQPMRGGNRLGAHPLEECPGLVLRTNLALPWAKTNQAGLGSDRPWRECG